MGYLSGRELSAAGPARPTASNPFYPMPHSVHVVLGIVDRKGI
jgi:hypothetical protein